MDIHILNGNGFGGVESLFYRLLLNQEIPNIRILFLGNIPHQFKEEEIYSYLISKYEVVKNRKKVRTLIPHADYKGFIWLFFCKYFLGLKVLPVSHGVLRNGVSNRIMYFLLSIEKFILNLLIFDKKIAISNNSGLDYYCGNFKVISYTPKNARFKIRTSDKTKRKIKLCCIGRFHSNWKVKSSKNQEYVFKILRQLDKNQINYEMLFIGAGEEYDLLFRKYSPIGDVKRIEFIEDDINILAKSDLLLAPSIHESFGQAILWAQLLGTRALVSTNICEEVNIGGCTFLGIGNTDVSQWCTKILEASKNLTIPLCNPNKNLKELVYEEYLTKLQREAVSNNS